MGKWRLLIGVTSVVMLIGAASEFTAHGRWGQDGASHGGWFYSALGLSGLFVLAVPRSGYVVAVVQLMATAYALSLGVLAFVLALAWSGMPWYLWFLSPAIPALILAAAGMMALLCGVNAVSAWQIARRTSSLGHD
jgi:hypothetical protein